MKNFTTLGVRLSLNQLRLDSYIGAYPHEFDKLQPISIDIAVEVKQDFLPHHDELVEVFNYDWLRDSAIKLATSKHFHLLETLTLELVELICQRPEIISVTIKVCKLSVYEGCQSVCCEMTATPNS